MHHWGSLTGLFWIVSGPTLATYLYLKTSRPIIVCYELITLYLVRFVSPSLTFSMQDDRSTVFKESHDKLS